MSVTFWILGALVISIAAIRAVFAQEIKACLERDPAAHGTLEVLLNYSGLHAIMFHRAAHALNRIKMPLLPRFIMTIARWITAIEIHPAAKIGRGLFIDHGSGVVIGETAVIGDNVSLFQGVTLGGTGKERGKRHPRIGDRVVIGAGAKVLGNIKIGNDSMVGANAVVTRDVPEHSTVVGVPGRIRKTKGREFPGINLDHTHLPDPLTERLEHLQREIDIIERHLKEHHRSASESPPE